LEEIAFTTPSPGTADELFVSRQFCITFHANFFPGDSETRGGPDGTNRPVFSCLTPNHIVLSVWKKQWLYSKREHTIGPSIYRKETKSGRS